MLSTLALTAEVQALAPDNSSDIFKAVLKRNPDYLNIALTDLKGRVLASGRPFSKTSLADRKHVQDALAGQDFAVGEYVVTRVGTEEPAIAFAYPVLDPEGNPRGVLTTTISLDHFAGFYDVADLPADSFIAITDHRGIRLFYYPHREKTNPVGRPINPMVWDAVKNARGPGIFVYPGSDGIRRIFAFEYVHQTFQEAPYAIMWAGIPEAHILKTANDDLIRNLLFMGLATVLALVISWLIGRYTLVSPIKRLVDTTRNFASGNLDARSDQAENPHELGVLARAFDDMADALTMGHQTLREREAFIRAVLDNLPIGVAVNTVEPTVKFDYMNDNFPRFYRTTRDALSTPDAFWEAVYEDPEFREQIRERVLTDCAGNDPEKMHWEDIPITRSGAETCYVSARNTPILDKNVMISLVWDVTDQKKAEKERYRLQDQLAQAQKMESIGRLAGGVAHDFNNIISIILGYAQLALTKIDPGDRLYKNMKEIETASLRSAELTRQLLAFARKQPVAPQVLDLDKTLEAMGGMLNRLIGEDVGLVWQLHGRLWPVKMDPSQIDQIMVNLCVNARDAIAGVGRITISTANISLDRYTWMGDEQCPPGDYVMITVSDTGCGMDKDTLANIFDPFFTTKGLGRGTGLGLAMVFGIIKQNQGFITVSSKPGQGATFKIHLPRFSGRLRTQTITRDGTTLLRGEGETILLVEDDLGVMDLCRTVLVDLGYNVLSAGLPEDAIRLAQEYAETIDLLITDVIMPEMNGRDLASALTKICPDLKCLFMSGYTADIIGDQGVLQDGMQFIQKPFSVKDISQSVHQALFAL